MVLAGLINKKESKKVLQKVETTEGAIKPCGPYLYHFYKQELINSGLDTEAKNLMSDYWRGMINKGADTFWEVYDPNNEELSPYNFYPLVIAMPGVVHLYILLENIQKYFTNRITIFHSIIYNHRTSSGYIV